MSFLSRLFGQDPKKLFFNFDLEDSQWRVVSWNFDVKAAHERRWIVESHGKSKNVIKWIDGQQRLIEFSKDQKVVQEKKLEENNSELKDLMNICLHTALKFSLESNHSFMLSPVSGATTSDYPNEAKYLQWIQATFGTLSRSLERFKVEKDLILTGAVFSGLAPDTQEQVLRVIIFNLDIFYYMRPDQTLQIAVFDDKNQGHGNSKTPVFQQIIKVTKPQFYDEIVRLVHQIATVGELK